MSNKRTNESLDNTPEEKVCEPEKKVSKTTEGPFDFYQFVGEEQPFIYATVETNSNEGKLMREKIELVMKKELPEQVRFFVVLQEHLLDNEEFSEGIDADHWKEVKELAKEGSSWQVIDRQEWAPIKFNLPIANVYILNTWC
jgi:hypothetical protein